MGKKRGNEVQKKSKASQAKLIEHLLYYEYLRSTKNVIVNKTKTPLSIMEFKF